VLWRKSVIEQLHQVFGEAAEDVGAARQKGGVRVDLAACRGECDDFLRTVDDSLVGCVEIPAEGTTLSATDSDDLVGHD
jgi:hypothetical protein